RFIQIPPRHNTRGRSFWDARDPRWYFRLAIQGVARELLPRGPGAEPRTGVRQPAFQLPGDQRHALLAAAPRELPGLVRRDAARLSVRDQGGAVHHAL